MTKKMFLSLGSVLVASSPVLTVIACGSAYAPTEEELERYKVLTSPQTLKLLENEWQYLVLNNESDEDLKKELVELNTDHEYIADVDLSKMPEIVAFAKRLLTYTIQNNSRYLVEIANTLGNINNEKYVNGTDMPKQNVYDSNWLIENGFKDYTYGAIDLDDIGANDLSDDAIRLLLTSDRIDFKNTLLQALVARTYLTISKDQWGATYPDDARFLSSVEKIIDEEKFVLVQELIDKKYFAKWEITLDDPDTLSGFIDLDEKTFAQSYQALTNNGIFGQSAKEGSQKNPNVQHSSVVFDFEKLSAINLGNDLIGYTGVQTLSTTTIKFGEKETYEEITSYDAWTGFVTDDNFVIDLENDADEEKIEWLTPEDKEAKPSLTFVKGIMPIYANLAPEGEEEKNRITVNDAEEQEILDFLAIIDTDLYSKAMDYYITRVDNSDDESQNREPIILEILSKDYEKILKEEFNLKFIEEQEVEE